MRYIIALFYAFFLTSAVTAETSDVADGLVVELNTVKTDNSSCALTFVVTNNLPEVVEELVFETVLFTVDGKVERLTLFSFGEIPAGRQRVRQFSVADVSCEALGQVLFNGAQTCTGAALTPRLCEASLVTLSRTGIKVSN